MNFYYKVNKTLLGSFFNSTGYPKKLFQIQTRLSIGMIRKNKVSSLLTLFNMIQDTPQIGILEPRIFTDARNLFFTEHISNLKNFLNDTS